jgi:hypothetical protein
MWFPAGFPYLFVRTVEQSLVNKDFVVLPSIHGAFQQVPDLTLVLQPQLPSHAFQVVRPDIPIFLTVRDVRLDSGFLAVKSVEELHVVFAF